MPCDSRYERLAEAFEGNFTSRGDVGAALAVVKEGQLVVNLWSGFRDANQQLPWLENTLTNIWSTTKGVVAACAAILVDRGQLDYEKPVSYYWPAFAANGKADITVRMLLSHQAGLCGFADPVDIAQLYNGAGAAERLAAMAPLWQPGDGCGYHAVTVGYLLNALFLHTDGRSIKQFFAHELRDTHGLDIHIGLPADRTEGAATILAQQLQSSDQKGATLSRIQQAALANPPLSPELPNTEAWRAAEIPAANGYATACSLAELYGALANNGELRGKTLVHPSVITDASAIAVGGLDQVLGMEVNWAAGFMRNSQALYGPSERAFGHSGWGGSFAFADPQRRIGMAYVMNNMGSELAGDPRNAALIDALYAS
jgi:CubicO group peptidase (beta-lactamase class C family)